MTKIKAPIINTVKKYTQRLFGSVNHNIDDSMLLKPKPVNPLFSI